MHLPGKSFVHRVKPLRSRPESFKETLLCVFGLEALQTTIHTMLTRAFYITHYLSYMDYSVPRKLMGTIFSQIMNTDSYREVGHRRMPL